MRRKIELYIDGSLADLSDQALVLYNYSLTDLQKPSAVKNSFSKQVTLPGTPANDAIFNYIYRPDRLTAAGTFHAGKKTAFTIYDEKGEILESGYLRLDAVTRKGPLVTGYKCSLFGGLGSFFYSLSYDENGNKKTLADLQYLDGSPTELDFDITKTAVTNAWSRLYNYPYALSSKWDVINFAPAYNGCPDGDFSADKGIVVAGNVGLQTSVTEGDQAYKTNAGNTLVNLPHAVDEWAAKDLRSYLQRPVLSMKAFLAAIANPENNGGYEVDYSTLYSYYKLIWKTLPTLPSLGSMSQSEGSVTMNAQALVAYHSNSDHDVFNIYGGSIPTGANCTYTGSFRLRFAASAGGAASLTLHASKQMASGTRNFYLKDVVLFAQVVAYGPDNTMVGGSKVKVFSSLNRESVDYWVEKCGYTPPYAAAEYENALTVIDQLNLVEGYYRTEDFFDFNVEGVQISKMLLNITAYKVLSYTYVTHGSHGRDESHWELTSVSGGTSACPVLSASYDTEYQASTATAQVSSGTQTVYYTTPSSLRSGAHITKRMLLSSKYTPAEYLIAFCKQFGIMFVCDKAKKKVTLLSRNDFYDTGAPEIDLTARVDKSKDITIQPLAMKSKWYGLKNELAEGSFAKEYKSIYGVDYGIQRVNTGYDFDTTEVDLMDGTPFRAAASVLQHNKYWVRIYVNGQFRPSPFLDRDVTYTLWGEDDGAAKSFPVPGIPTNATLNMYNINRDYYDVEEVVLRLDLSDAEGKPVDGEDILVYYNGGTTYTGFKVSDDTAAMMALNGGKPCWDLNVGTSDPRVPTFTRHYQIVSAVEYYIRRGLDFGVPREVDIPDCVFGPYGSCYLRYWKQYLHDLLDKDTKVLKCRVHLDGLQVGPELLRRFFWYEGSVWVLNQIKNYSLTTYDAAECEFVKVKDKENYTNGQTWENID